MNFKKQKSPSNFVGQFAAKEFNLDKLYDRDSLISRSVETGPNDQTFYRETLEENLKHEFPDSDWTRDIRDKSKTILNNIILAATSKNHRPPASMAQYPQSRLVKNLSFRVLTEIWIFDKKKSILDKKKFNFRQKNQF